MSSCYVVIMTKPLFSDHSQLIELKFDSETCIKQPNQRSSNLTLCRPQSDLNLAHLIYFLSYSPKNNTNKLNWMSRVSVSSFSFN